MQLKCLVKYIFYFLSLPEDPPTIPHQMTIPNDLAILYASIEL